MNIFRPEETVKAESCAVTGILAFESESESVNLDPLRGDMRDFCRRCVVNEKFTGKAGTELKVPFIDGSEGFVLVVGLGKETESGTQEVREGAFKVINRASSAGHKDVYLRLPNAESRETARAAAEGAALGCYRFDKYITKDEDDRFAPVETCYVEDADERGLFEGKVIGESQCYARDIANEPANVISPETLAEKAKELAEEVGLECEIWDEKRIAEEKMGAYLAVGSGSANPPRFIRLTWTPKTPHKRHIAFVGKGMTFDSGGLDIKPAEYMLTMKGDKSGACAVIGAIRAAALLELPVKVTAVTAAAENMPDGGAYRPDDILTARNGKTIEVDNTDAEGRLTLADALCYVSELKPDAILDIATLTGACAVALGRYTSGFFSNSDELAEKFMSSSKKSGERFWRFPMDDKNLRKTLKSPVADMLNTGPRYGGAITAAMFLEEFVDKSIPWGHLDIAAADHVKEPYSYYVKGATAFGTRTLALFALEMGECGE